MKIICLWCRAVIPQVWTINRLFSFSDNIPAARCDECEAQLKVVDRKQCCPGCSRAQKDTALCYDCERWQLAYPRRELQHVAIFQYEGLIRDWLHAFKYQGDYRLVKFLGKEWAAAIQPYVKTHRIIPIPISLASTAKRGFNQVEAMLAAADIPYHAILEQKPSMKKQAEKNRQERMEGLQPFLISPEAIIEPQKPVLIVDDVYTTGRTLHHARDVLEGAGVIKAETLTLAR